MNNKEYNNQQIINNEIGIEKDDTVEGLMNVLIQDLRERGNKISALKNEIGEIITAHSIDSVDVDFINELYIVHRDISTRRRIEDRRIISATCTPGSSNLVAATTDLSCVFDENGVYATWYDSNYKIQNTYASYSNVLAACIGKIGELLLDIEEALDFEEDYASLLKAAHDLELILLIVEKLSTRAEFNKHRFYYSALLELKILQVRYLHAEARDTVSDDASANILRDSLNASLVAFNEKSMNYKSNPIKVYSVVELLDCTLEAMFEYKKLVRRCKICGRYFCPDIKNTQFCKLPHKGSDKTCFEIREVWRVQKYRQNTANELYSKIYNRLRGRNPESDELNNFVIEARNVKENKSEEEYIEWLKQKDDEVGLKHVRREKKNG